MELKDMVLNIIGNIETGIQCEDVDEYDGQYEVGETISGYDYLTDVLDIEYIISSSREYMGARVLICFGGPNIWINTRLGVVEGYWWGESFSESYHGDAMDLDGALAEFWEMGA